MSAAPVFIALTGPTTSGKTDLSLQLAERLPVEIVSMDSRQVYAGMDIGTDKVAGEARRAVPHHGLDLVRPDERYSAGRFARDARGWIREIRGRGATPILVGGTGFFLRALLEPVFTEPDLDADRLTALRAYLGLQPPERLARWVHHLDPARAELAVEGGAQRMSRTVEVALLTGVRLSEWHRTSPPDGEALPGLVAVLDLPRDEMDRRIDDRVTRMVERGLVEEVRGLAAAGHVDADPGMTGTGYREVAAYLRGEVGVDEALDNIRKATRQYARRQLTWFRNQLPADTIRIDGLQPLERQADAVLAAWEARGGGVALARESSSSGQEGA